MKSKNGITLIALVITIIVLIILAGISIKMLIGKNGIVETAKWSAYVTEYEAVDEAKELYAASKILYESGKDVKDEYMLATIGNIEENREESKYPISEKIEINTISETLKQSIIKIENLTESDLTDENIVNLYKIDLEKLKIKAKKEYAVNIVSGQLYSIQAQEYKEEVYHTPRLGVVKSGRIDKVGTYEIIIDAGQTVSWDSVEIFYEKYVENSLNCTVFTSDNEINWEEEEIELESNTDKTEEKYKISEEANRTQYLKVQVKIDAIDKGNSIVDYILVNFYKYEETNVVPEIEITENEENIEKTEDGIYTLQTQSNGEKEAEGTGKIKEKIEVPSGEDGDYMLDIEEVEGTPEIKLKMTQPDGTTQEETITDLKDLKNKKLPPGSTVELEITLEAGDGIGEAKLKKKSENLTTQRIDETSPKETNNDNNDNNNNHNDNARWVTVEKNKYMYNNGGKGYWEKCLINDQEVDETGIIEEEPNAKRIKVSYQTSADGKTYGGYFTDIAEAGNTRYLKVIIEYQVKGEIEYGDTSANKIKVILNDGSWKIDFKDEDGTKLFTKRVYFTSNEQTGTLEMPNIEDKEGNLFAGWKKEDKLYVAGIKYTATEDTSFTAHYINQNIYKIEDLEAFRDAVNSGNTFEKKTINLMNDLDLSSVCSEEQGSWEPIGNYTEEIPNIFKGTFHGGNHKIDYLYINNATSDYQGLFGYVEGGTITGVVIGENSNIIGNSLVGGIAGHLYDGKIEKCGNHANVAGTSIIGGIVGDTAQSEMIGSYNKGDITSSDGYMVGGIIGNSSGNCILNYCYNTGDVVGAYYVGGMTGEGFDYIEIYHCYNKGTITATSKTGSYVYEGGIAGRLRAYGIASYCYNLGEIHNTNTGMYTGGIIGLSHAYNGSKAVSSRASSVSNCYNANNVISMGTRVGGIVGYNVQYCSVKNCYISNAISVQYNSTSATANIGKSSSYLGNIVGYAYSTSSTYIDNVDTLDSMPTVYYVVNEFSNGESEYWSNSNVNEPKLLWEEE